MKTVDEMANIIVNELHTDDIDYFLNFSEPALLHHSAGRAIRNRFGLWDREWEPEIVDGVDHSPEHPDTVSMDVVMKVIEILKEREQH